MTSYRKVFRLGILGALMDEYEKATWELQALLAIVPDADFSQIVDTATQDDDCRSMQTILRHVVRSGYGYANYIRTHFNQAVDTLEHPLPSRTEAIERLNAVITYTVATLETHWHMTDSEIAKVVIQSRWGVTYDLEQLLEHAIVHILRHRRQLEKFLVLLATNKELT